MAVQKSQRSKSKRTFLKKISKIKNNNVSIKMLLHLVKINKDFKKKLKYLF